MERLKEAGLSLQEPEMDANHEEYLQLQERVRSNGLPLVEGLEAVLEHSRRHFAEEEAWMEAGGYAGIGEHKEEHRKILGEMEGFLQMAKKGRTPFARAYVNQGMPERLAHHIRNIDSELAAWKKGRG